ncbi:MAG: hypothetical protein JWL59_4807 [Chthoniobacteraceae bacterium]|nr:hypothetical protein [Chthoniobacteraceae bacterium]
MLVETKAQNFRLYEGGVYGNKLKTWDSLDKVRLSSYIGRVVMRYKGRLGGARYPGLGEQVSQQEARVQLSKWLALGAREAEVVYNEAAPDEGLLIQGELMRSIDYYSLFWSSEKTTMRLAMRNGRQVHGLKALFLLKEHLFPSSFVDLEELLVIFPDAVVEFSAYRFALGSIPNRNTIIWEVRNY